MRYSITSSNLRNFQRIGKNVSIGKNGILNPLGILHTTKFLALEEALNIYMDYLMCWCLLKQTTCEMKALQVQALHFNVYIQQWLHEEQGAKFM